MDVRFGYVAMSEHLVNASPSQTMTAKQFEQLANKEAGLLKLERIAKTNLKNCLRLLKHNKAHDISFFRLSSRLVPLVNHPLTTGWKYERAIRLELEELGDFVKNEKMRIDFHPNHFVVLNSPSKKVFTQSLQTLLYHYKLLKGMGIDTTHRCVIHIGGKKHGKEAGLEQFIANFADTPKPIQRMIMIENDDVNYTIEDTLYVGEKLGIPVVFDLHHYDVNQQSTELEELWKRVITTWDNSPFPVKMHVSSPKDGRLDRRHHEFINAHTFADFLSNIAGSTSLLDVMIEAKKKDEALFQLMKDLVQMEQFEQLTQASIKVRIKNKSVV
ncbi:UV DNA damage repair endonuclease UvsE [Halalkalibacter urbisdiaboli]|uniref:UV DNA damage repair endonuclease UvsE n=1 Tax=Halalkalibacter urbisdiaboli TaxID=1960589 RepID=UPI000B453F93|nr:UV DNA damage repair endonuclease UvsE [Halalkalibacter urbisdiaboli]